jgi:hypothetical protein
MLNKVLQIRTGYFVALAVPLLLSLNLVFDKHYLIDRQLSLQKGIYNPLVDSMLYSRFSDRRLDGEIVTNYQIMKHLPGFEARTHIVDLGDWQDFSEKLSMPKVKYLLMLVGTGSETVNALIIGKLKAGQYRLIDNVDGHVLIRIR